MADLTPSRIEPLGASPENHSENSGCKPAGKPKANEKPASTPPPVDVDKDELHQLDEQA